MAIPWITLLVTCALALIALVIVGTAPVVVLPMALLFVVPAALFGWMAHVDGRY